MVRFWKICAAGIGLLLSACAAPRAGTGQEPSAPSPEVVPELAPLLSLEGKWTCEGTQPARGDQPAVGFESSLAVSRQMGGHWFLMRYQQQPAGELVQGWHSAGYWGYDAVEQAFVMTAVDDRGGAYRATSQGWQGDEWVWEGETRGGGRSIPFRRVLTRSEEHTLTARWQLGLGDGQWRTIDEETCRRAGR